MGLSFEEIIEMLTSKVFVCLFVFDLGSFFFFWLCSAFTKERISGAELLLPDFLTIPSTSAWLLQQELTISASSAQRHGLGLYRAVGAGSQTSCFVCAHAHCIVAFNKRGSMATTLPRREVAEGHAHSRSKASRRSSPRNAQIHSRR